MKNILRALPRSRALKKDAILEAKDLNTLLLEELLGSFLTHEMGLQEDEEDRSKSDRRREVPLNLSGLELIVVIKTSGVSVLVIALAPLHCMYIFND